MSYYHRVGLGVQTPHLAFSDTILEGVALVHVREGRRLGSPHLGFADMGGHRITVFSVVFGWIRVITI